MKKWKIKSSELVLDNPFMKVRKDVVQLPTGERSDDYFVWVCGDVAMTVPVTKEGKLVLVRQYKHGAGEVMIEFPAGLVNEPEDVLAAAKRELLEETGYEGGEWKFLAKLQNSPTKRVGVVKVYVATGVEKMSLQHLDELEDIEVLELTPDGVEKMITDGEIWASDAVAGYYLWKRKSGE